MKPEYIIFTLFGVAVVHIWWKSGGKADVQRYLKACKETDDDE